MASRMWPNNRLQDRHKPNTSFLLIVVAEPGDDELRRPSAADFGIPAADKIVDCSIGVGALTAECVVAVVGVDCNEPA